MNTEIKKLNQDIEMRNKILSFEKLLSHHKDVLIGKDTEDICPVKHTFVDGAYIREIFMPAGVVLTSKIHKICHPFFVLTGRVSVVTEEGLIEIVAPYHGITPAGTKRALHVHEDCIWITVHVTNKTNVDEIEEEIIAKDFKEIENLNNKEESLICHGQP